LIYQIDDIDSSAHVLITIVVFSMNVLLMAFMVFKFIMEVVFEFQHEKKKTQETRTMHCLVRCTKQTLRCCPCLKDEDSALMARVASLHKIQLNRFSNFQSFRMKKKTPGSKGQKNKNKKGRGVTKPERRKSNNPCYGKTAQRSIEMTAMVKEDEQEEVQVNGAEQVNEGEQVNQEEKVIEEEADEEMVDIGTPSMENWETTIDPVSGNAYLYNNETGESKWANDDTSELSTVKRNPMLAGVGSNDVDAEEDSDWIRAFDDTHEAWYWYNKVTKVRQDGNSVQRA
jgi:hypothetical protein